MNTSALRCSLIALAIVATPSIAQDVTGNATVTVKNSFTFTEDAPLNFGEISATAGATATTDIATLTISSDGTVNAADNSAATAAQIRVLTAGSAGTYSISGVAPYSSLTLDLTTLNSNSVELTAVSGAPGAATFTVDNFEATVTVGNNVGDSADNSTPIVADASGSAGFALGAVLTTDAAGTSPTYYDEEYTGTFTLTVDY
ncbi:DUF4402 domain-containing protein [Ferrimonas lipolytica]|uniref:DUF4402 domain-containing protein n=1 Tax=Ferrimonas lipolytica TaxID=2724191 RepID=A0A6H1UFV2_9GAMM|nr:DUF4402 domain-containing protein [Ferrimonas lipolytica]QIZ77480.1 DUF4402 domain-containing protein [Ferrimonas lipolytica]